MTPAFIGDSTSALRRDLTALIARATEMQTGNQAANHDLRGLADTLRDSVEYLDDADYELGANDRALALEAEIERESRDHRWDRLHLSVGA